MKKEVIKFLAEQTKSKPEQFNQALSLYRRSKDHNAGQVRFMNSLGYSEDRLNALLYDLKKLHGITDLEVANARKKPVKEVKPTIEELKQEFEENIVLIYVDSTNENELKAIADAFCELYDQDRHPEDQNGVISDRQIVQNAKDYFIRESKQKEALENFANLTIEELQNNTLEANQEIIDTLNEVVFLPRNEWPEGLAEKAEALEKDLKLLTEKKNAAKDIEVNDPETVGANESSEEKEATDPDVVVLNADDLDKPETGTEENDTDVANNGTDVSENDTDVSKNETSEEETVQEGDASERKEGTEVDAEKAEFLKKLQDFDVEKEEYNSMKSFAADLADFIKEEPADQKKVTLQAFIQAAKKKLS